MDAAFGLASGDSRSRIKRVMRAAGTVAVLCSFTASAADAFNDDSDCVREWVSVTVVMRERGTHVHLASWVQDQRQSI